MDATAGWRPYERRSRHLRSRRPLALATRAQIFHLCARSLTRECDVASPCRHLGGFDPRRTPRVPAATLLLVIASRCRPTSSASRPCHLAPRTLPSSSRGRTSASIRSLRSRRPRSGQFGPQRGSETIETSQAGLVRRGRWASPMPCAETAAAPRVLQCLSLWWRTRTEHPFGSLTRPRSGVNDVACRLRSGDGVIIADCAAACSAGSARIR